MSVSEDVFWWRTALVVSVSEDVFGRERCQLVKMCSGRERCQLVKMCLVVENGVS